MSYTSSAQLRHDAQTFANWQGLELVQVAFEHRDVASPAHDFSDVIARVPGAAATLGSLLTDYARTNQFDAFKKVLAIGRTTREVINFQDEDGFTALHHAAAVGSRSAARLLVGTTLCDYALRDKFGRAAAHLAIQWTKDRALARWLSVLQFKQRQQKQRPTNT